MTNRIRPAAHHDLGPIKAIALETELFAADEVTVFDDMVTGALDGSLTDHVWLVLEDSNGEVAGAAYYAPEPFSDRLWNLYFLGVRPDEQGKGGGRNLVGAVEGDLRARGRGPDDDKIVYWKSIATT